MNTIALRAVLQAPAQSIPEVIAIMQGIENACVLPDGVGFFNKLYKTVTERVAACIQDGAFTHPDFVDRLDVVFANLYFAAMKAYITDPATTPRAWKPLFQRTSAPGIAPIQFALAGMNAHINRDLPVAVVAVAKERGLFPGDQSAEKGDYDQLNPILEEVETTVRAWFLQGFMKDFDGMFEKIDTVVANFSLVEARAAAWENAEGLWHVRNIPFASDTYLQGLDGLVGFAGRGLMVPVGLLAA